MAALVALAGCAVAPPAGRAASPAAAPLSAPAPGAIARYRCDHGITFTVLFENGSAVVDAGPRGSNTLQRDAGEYTPQQAVYSGMRLRAEFGLGPNSREAVLHYRWPAVEAHCVRD